MIDFELLKKSTEKGELEFLSDIDLPPFVWIPDFISLAGSVLYERHGREAGDIDIIVRAESDENGNFFIKLDPALRLKIDRILKSRFGEKSTQWLNSTYGPNWRFKPLFNLTLTPIENSAIQEVGEKEFAEEFYKEEREKREEELLKIKNIENYKPPEPPLSERQLAQTRDDMRIACGWYSTFKETEGEGIKFSEEEIIKVATKILNALILDGRTEFHPENWKAHSKELYLLAFERLIKRGLYLVPPHGKLIYEGKKKIIVKSKKFDFLKEFNILVSDKKAYGYIRCFEPEKKLAEGFSTTFNLHRITEEERMKWWAGIKGLYFYQIRDFIPFDNPKDVKLPIGIQVGIQEVEFVKRAEIKKYISLIKGDDKEKQIVYGIVYEPNIPDSQGDMADEEEIERAAHKFMADYRHLSYMHQVPETGAEIVESFIAPTDMQISHEKVRKGSWVLGVHVSRGDLWKEIKAGTITGFSMEGKALTHS